MDRLDFSDAKSLLSKIAKGKLKSNSNLIDEMVKLSDRTPFNLVYIADVIAWAEDRIKKVR